MLIKNSPFAKLSQSKVLSLISTSQVDIEESSINRALYDGKHWGRDGYEAEFWIGPLPHSSAADYDDLRDEIKRHFNSRNVIREVVDRRVDGLLKSRPQMNFSRKKQVTETNPLVPTEKEKIQEAESLFRTWFVQKKILKKIKEVYGRRLINEKVTVRLYIPLGLTDLGVDGKRRISGSIEECIEKIHLDVVVSPTSGEIVDENSQLTAHVCDFTKNNRRITELVYVENDETVIRRMQTLSAEGLTQDKVEEAKEEQDELGEVFRLRIGKRSTMYEPRPRAMITQQVRENQFAINLAKTMQNRNTITGGFLERVITDAMPPGKWVDDPENEGKQKYELGPFKVGGGRTNFFMAAEYKDEETGEVRWGNPSVYFKDPVSQSTFIDAKRDCYQDILEEVGQPHILIAGDATASARSRETAKETYRGTLEDDEGEIVPMITWLMETVLAMGAFYANKPEHFDELSASAKCYMNLGPLAGNERQDNREDVKAGQLSVRTAMMRSGVEDPQEEFDRIKQENAESEEARDLRIEKLIAMVSAGFEPKGAAQFLGFKPEEYEQLNFVRPVIERKLRPDSPGPDPEPGGVPGTNQNDPENQ